MKENISIIEKLEIEKKELEDKNGGAFAPELSYSTSF